MKVGAGISVAAGMGALASGLLAAAVSSESVRSQPLLVGFVGLPVALGGISLATHSGGFVGTRLGAQPHFAVMAGMAGMAAGLGGMLGASQLTSMFIGAEGTAGKPEDAVGDVRGGVMREQFFVKPGSMLGSIDSTEGPLAIRAAGTEYSIGYPDSMSAVTHFINKPHADKIPDTWALVSAGDAPSDRQFRAVGVELVRADGTVLPAEHAPVEKAPSSVWMTDNPADQDVLHQLSQPNSFSHRSDASR